MAPHLSLGFTVLAVASRKLRRLLPLVLLVGCGPSDVPARAPTVDSVPVTAPQDGFVVMPSGSFVMGSPSVEPFREEAEGPTWEVTLSSPFLLGRTEVTVAEFETFVAAMGHVTDAERAGWAQGANGHERRDGLSWRAPGFPQGPSHPVVGVSWNDAAAYADWKSGLDGLPRCYGGPFSRGCTGWRLPTEAEWEWAARAGTTGAWGLLAEEGRGCEPTKLKTTAWMCANAGGGTQPVGELAPNAWGLHDMLGNAWEWVHDGFDDYPGEAEDPLGGPPGEDRANRGCGWGSRVEDCRVAMRVEDPPDIGFDNLGFRLARTLPQSRTDHRQALRRARSLLAKDPRGARWEAVRSLKLARVAEDMETTREAQALLLALSGGEAEGLEQHLSSQERARPGLRLGEENTLQQRVAADAAFFDARRYACPHEGLGLAFLTAAKGDYQRWRGDVPDAVPPGSPGLDATESAPAAPTPGSLDIAGLPLDVSVARLREAGPVGTLRAGWSQVCAPSIQGLAAEWDALALVVAPEAGVVADGACLRGLGGSLSLTLEFATRETLRRLGPQPSLRALDLSRTAIDGHALEALQAPGLQRIVLRETAAGDRSLRALAASAPALRDVDLWDSAVTDEGVLALAGAARGLTRLDLGSTRVTGEVLPTVATLAELTHLELYELDVAGGLGPLASHPRLAHLGLGATDVSAEDLAVLPTLSALRAVELAESTVDDEGLRHVGACAGLESLGLGGTSVSDEGVGHLASLAALRRLYLGQTDVGDEGLRVIGRLGALEHLVLGESRVTDEGLASLAGLRRLTHLELWRTGIGPGGLRALRNVPLSHLSLGGTRVGGGFGLGVAGQAGLRTLEIYDTDTRDADLAELALLSLRNLDLGNTPVGDAGLSHIAGMRTLQRLELGGTRVEDEGVASLVGLVGLRRLGLRETGITSAGLALLAPLTGLRSLHLGLTAVDNDGLSVVRNMPDLDDLDLRGTAVTDVEPLASLVRLRRLWLSGALVRDLSALARLGGLQDLRLFGVPLGEGGTTALSALVGLTTLDLRGTGLAGRSMPALGALHSLRSLRLDENDLADADLAPLSALPALVDLDLSQTGVSAQVVSSLGCPPRLESLSLRLTPLADAVLPVLARCSTLGGLDLTGTAVTGEGLAALASLPALDALELGATRVSDAQLSALASLRHLEELELWFTDVTDAGLPALARITALRELSIEGLPITDEGLAHLAALESLELLGLGATRVTEAGVAALDQEIEVSMTGEEPPDRE